MNTSASRNVSHWTLSCGRAQGSSQEAEKSFQGKRGVFHVPSHRLCCALTDHPGDFLTGLFPWHFYFTGQYALERFRADGERIRRDKGHGRGANTPEGCSHKEKLHM